jgi:hypothetical protein
MGSYSQAAAISCLFLGFIAVAAATAMAAMKLIARARRLRDARRADGAPAPAPSSPITQGTGRQARLTNKEGSDG